jgi:hypothetical protein
MYVYRTLQFLFQDFIVCITAQSCAQGGFSAPLLIGTRRRTEPCGKQPFLEQSVSDLGVPLSLAELLVVMCHPLKIFWFCSLILALDGAIVSNLKMLTGIPWD